MTMSGAHKRAPRRPKVDGGDIAAGVSKADVHSKVTARDDEWRKARQMGFLSFLVPLSIMAFLGTSIGEEAGKGASTSFRSSSMPETLLDPFAISLTVYYFGLWTFKEVFLNLFKHWLMTKAFKMSKQYYDLIIGPRTGWTGREIKHLCKTYSRERIKIMDAINRRTGHTLINIFRISFFLYVVPTTKLRLVTSALQLPIISTLKILTESGLFFWDIGRYIFQGSRVLDGRYGRFNLVVVNFWAYAGRIIMFQLILRRDMSEDVANVLWVLAMMPLLWGDAFGELVGSFYGKMKFKVRGLGEVNEKTVEGTLAVFLSSYAAMLVMYYYLMDPAIANESLFVFHPTVVFLYASVLASILESVAPRSTDNFFLEVGSLLVLLWSLA